MVKFVGIDGEYPTHQVVQSVGRGDKMQFRQNHVLTNLLATKKCLTVNMYLSCFSLFMLYNLEDTHTFVVSAGFSWCHTIHSV